jgi:hypothetical protein
MNLNAELPIIGLANALELDVNDPVEAIRTFCRQKVERFLRGASKVTSMVELQQIVCVHLNLTVHEIWSDEDMQALARQYVAAGEVIFSTLATQLSPDAFGVLFRLTKKGRHARFAAVIDCRGEKQHRRYWTLWHEIAHALTYVEQSQLALRRTTLSGTAKDPLEKITDMVASDFAFFDTLFQPAFHAEFNSDRRVTFALTERVRQRFCTDASLASTINACVTAAPMPTIMLEAGLEYKKSERERIAAGEKDILPSLRVLKSIPNEAARAAHLHIPRSMRVPITSVIARMHNEDIETIIDQSTAAENLSDWTTSDGSRLRDVDVVIEARRFGDRVLALVTAV